MGLIVQKYGGTSVGSVERIHRVAARALAAQAEGHQVVVIVSAMAGETNRLLGLAEQVSQGAPSGAGIIPDQRELDVIAATGEQVSSALLALAIHARGGRAKSLLGHQLKIRTDSAYTKARILGIEADAVRRALADGAVAVVAGFQGVDDDGNITTLGRGGSDTSAVAVAAAVGASVCEIYTDVDGVYTTDPNVCPSARKIERISYEEMLELASVGAKVLQIRSVELAMKYSVPIHVRSSFSDVPGTWVTGEDRAGRTGAATGSLESIVVTGVACDKNDARVMLVSVEDRPGVVARIFGDLARENISVDMIIQNAAVDAAGRTDVTFTVNKDDLPRVRPVMEALLEKVSAQGLRYDESVAKVSIVGLGMRSHAGVAARMFELLAAEGINIQAISTSEIKVSCLCDAKYAELAVRALHDGFGLGNAPGAKVESHGG
ncbi:MAG: aspartate kinase [Myxococcales bacterium]|nr:aspartate kinase [Myxococcales bacterium]